MYAAVQATTDPSAGETPVGAFPQGPQDIALWRQFGDGDAAGWERLEDKKSGADKWGL